jgi:hypothetical protein
MKTTFQPAGLLVLALCGAAGAEPNPEAWWARPGPDGVQRVNIRCGPDSMDPSHIVVRAGIPLELAVSGPADLPPHTFTAVVPRGQAQAVAVAVGPAQQRIAFVPSLVGRFKAACHDNNAGGNDPNENRKQGELTVIP